MDISRREVKKKHTMHLVKERKREREGYRQIGVERSFLKRETKGGARRGRVAKRWGEGKGAAL